MTTWKNYPSDRTLKNAIERAGLENIPYEVLGFKSAIRPVFYPIQASDIHLVRSHGFEGRFDALKSAQLS